MGCRLATEGLAHLEVDNFLLKSYVFINLSISRIGPFLRRGSDASGIGIFPRGFLLRR
jgi:hypothetical protein